MLASLIADQALEGVSGRYYTSEEKTLPSLHAVIPHTAAEFWQQSAELVDLELEASLQSRTGT